jgi:hypothetical protein
MEVLMEKKCQLCEGELPKYVVIDGKRRNLQRRKFCTECSPFGAHNTSKTPVASSKERKARRDKVRRLAVARFRRKLKRRLIEHKGGQCELCGYSKPVNGAYAFHHRDPSEKDFQVSNNLGKSWAALVEEVGKCDLLCVRCHAEVHDEWYNQSMSQVKRTANLSDDDETADERRERRTNTKQGGTGVDRGVCSDCGKRHSECKCYENNKK